MSAQEYYSNAAINPLPTPPFTTPSSPKPPSSTPYFRPSALSQQKPPPEQLNYYQTTGSPRPQPSNHRPTRTPSPLHYRPPNNISTNTNLTPYNASRPEPRRGFIRHIRSKISSFLSYLIDQARNHPFRTVLFGAVPALAGRWVYKAGKAVWKGVGGWIEGRSERVKKEMGKRGGVLDEFAGFGGSREGALDGLLKVLQMFVNHYCKLTPSSIPRLASIFLELYFLKDMVLQVASRQ